MTNSSSCVCLSTAAQPLWRPVERPATAGGRGRRARCHTVRRPTQQVQVARQEQEVQWEQRLDARVLSRRSAQLRPQVERVAVLVVVPQVEAPPERHAETCRGRA